ncbi:hypothetical protein GGR55DRAFT_94290 [Xylaria sp. FL0064]|nr:hypothetical protein GGR55DRAFT_94290 [Xylaria sp. FL0064]
MDSLPPPLAKCLQGRRDIDLTDHSSNNLTTNASRAENTIRTLSMQGRGGSASNQRETNPVVASVPSSTFVGHPPPNGTDYSSLPGLEHSQVLLENTMSRRHSVMTTGGVRHSSAAPSIVVGTYNQQQPTSSGPSSLQRGTEQLNLSTSGTPSQFLPGVGQRRSSTRSQVPSNSSHPQPYIVIGWDTPIPVIARRDMCPNSYIYADVVSNVLAGSDHGRHVRPWPPGRGTTTGAGYDPTGGQFILLTLRNRASLSNGEGHDVQLPFTIVHRDQVLTPIDGMAIDIVLGQDYIQRLSTLQTTSVASRQQAEGSDFLDPNYQGWQLHDQSQNSLLSSENSLFDSNYHSMAHVNVAGWQSGSSQTQSLRPLYLTGSSYATMSSGQESSGIIVTSATSPDAPFGPTLFYSE